ncbi:hypothetical protein AB7M35_003392 [Amorphus suaedae]
MVGRKAVLFLGLALMAFGLPAKADDGASKGPAVVELFTSQGCASCPPADKLLGRLLADRNVIALTYPVTLWDYLGWPDTLASRENTERQFAYAQARGDSAVYTPQVVVNGREDVVGNNERAVRHEIDGQTAQGLAPSVRVGLERNGSVLELRIGAAKPGAPKASATIWLGSITPEVKVDIGRGENSGRSIVYHNVVRSLRAVGMWKGDPVSIDMPVDEISRDGGSACVVLVQLNAPAGPGAIIGAATASWPAPVANARVTR